MTLGDKLRSGHSFFIFTLALAIPLALAAYFAPRFLAYADKPVRSDAVVLFIGPGFSAREMEAWRLIKEGYARYLLIPARGVAGENSSAIFGSVGFLREMEKFYKSNPQGATGNMGTLFTNGKLPVQNTHLEILEAKRLMTERGLRTAIFVSSPYHMRRIKIITGSVFGEDGEYAIAFVPTSFEKLPGGLSGLCKYAYQSVIQEYLKISAFLAYSYFGV